MRIGILGAGHMAEALAPHWRAAGHDIVVGARSAAKAAALAERLGVRAATLDEAAEHGEGVLVAITYGPAAEVVRGLAARLDDTVLIDCTNAVVPGETGPMLATGGGPSAAERLASAAPKAHVVKAFNLCADSVWHRPPAGLAVPICGDDSEAMALVSTLVRDAGCLPQPMGGLERAAYVEAAAAWAIGVWSAGGDPRAAFPELSASGH